MTEMRIIFMKRQNVWKKLTACCLTAAIATVMLVNPMTARADSEEGNSDISGTYVSLGADLKESERATVLELLGLTEDDLNNCTVIQTTNAEEHEYLDDYLDNSLIGSRALSSVKVISTSEGSGINVETHNITYCTTTMYENALATAGIENAEVTVAGPFNVSGTAGLIGAIKAYETMTGNEADPDNVDAATQELVTTSELGEDMEDQDTAANLVGAVKDKVVSEGLTSEEDIEDAIDSVATQMDVDLTDSQKEQIAELMDDIKDLDLDVDTLKEQAQGLYDKLDSMGIDLSSVDTDGLFDKICNWAKSVWNSFFG
jgi:uncharacterized protein YpuA (DUF1002 family)